MADETSVKHFVQEQQVGRHDDETATTGTRRKYDESLTDDANEAEHHRQLTLSQAITNGTRGAPRTVVPSPCPPVNEEDGDTNHHYGEEGRRKRHGARNQHKMKHFVRWLLETFPELLIQPPSHGTSENSHDLTSKTQGKEKEQVPKLSSSSSPSPPPLVLDVAGGKGELAARLCLCHHLRVILVDPRPANVAQAYQQVVVPRLPKKWQDRLKQRLANNPNFVQDVLDQRFRQVVDYFSLQAVVNKESSKHDENVNDDKVHQTALHEAVQEASLLIGMHADGATEDIVDVALQYQKPFVVVPCCVFANLFCHRKVRAHAPQQQHNEQQPMAFTSVRTHEQFCQYLLDKDARFQKSILPFEGRNVAIWWDGK